MKRTLVVAGAWLALAGMALAPPVYAETTAAPRREIPPIHGKGQYAESPHGRIYYETEGSGPAVFLVAGGPGAGHASFHPWFSELAKDHTVVYFDNIGRGRSDRLKDPKGYTVERDADDIEALRKALGLPKISLIGHSYGGYPALAYALKYPDRTARLVLSDTLHNDRAFQANIDNFNRHVERQFPEIWAEIRRMRSRGVKSSDDRYGEVYSRATADVYWYDTAHEDRMFWGEDTEDGFNGEVYLAMLGDDPEWIVGGTLKGYDPTDRMRKMKTPTLIAVGRYDRIATPLISTEMRNRIPGSRLIVFERSGHRPWVEEPEKYFAAVREFLAP